ncbi:MAG TPA: hypothetical protein VFM96_04660 [Gaiellaceae bacterium]|nr:hypothetical protein [Gaiellaceae bacterium]
MPKRLDTFLVLAAAALLIAVFFDAARRWSPRGGSVSEVPAATVPQLVRLVPSSTAFLVNCPAQDLHLSVGRGRTLTLRFAGGRCHVPPLHLREVVRDAKGAAVYRGPALATEALSGNYAISGSAQAELLGPCGSVAVSGSGLRASAAVPCP